MKWYYDPLLLEDQGQILSRLESKKAMLDAFRPLPDFVLHRLTSDIAIEWTYHSNSIEGNTLNLNETRIVLEQGMTIHGKSLREHFEVVNHHNAIEYISALIHPNYTISERDILDIHRIVLTNIEKEFSGRYRNGGVRIVGANFIPPNALKVSDLIHELLQQTALAMQEWPVAWVATLFHHHFVHIHPFFDGNGRTVRLLMNILLMSKGYPPAIILQQDRKKYYQALNQANNGKYDKLFLLILQAMERSLSIFLDALPSKENDDDYAPISMIVSQPSVPYGQEYVSLLARRGLIDAYKDGRNWFTKKSAVLDYYQKINHIDK
jgi:Fic family protein